MTSTVTHGGKPIRIGGDLPKIGSVAPPFSLVGKDLEEVTLASFVGQRKVLNVFPSVDTPTCAMSVRQFNKAASSLVDTVVICISADLPFAQSRFCGAEGLSRVVTLSTMRGRSFLQAYGLQIETGPFAGLAARAVIVLDVNDVVRYVELVPEIKQEPNYEAALKALAI